jgi:adenosylcobinamide-GDP ribazoletransferase
MKALLIALQLLTTIPVRVRGELTQDAAAGASAWFSLVGLMLGTVLAAADLGLRRILPAGASAALVVTLWIALTGAIHFDGFLDCCDALLGSHTPERRLEILRDSRVGAFAVAGGVCLLLVKYAALAEMQGVWRTPALFVLPALTRASMVYAMRAYPYARSGPGMGAWYRDGISWWQVVVAAAVATVAAVLVIGWLGLALMAWVWLVTVIVAWLVQRRIPGLTGDGYGAINEITEVAGLLLVLVVGHAQ